MAKPKITEDGEGELRLDEKPQQLKLMGADGPPPPVPGALAIESEQAERERLYRGWLDAQAVMLGGKGYY